MTAATIIQEDPGADVRTGVPLVGKVKEMA